MTQEKIHCLIAEDDQLMADVLQETLRDHSSISTTVVSNGKQALEILASGLPIDILVTDLNMPGIGGEELLNRVRKISPQTLILVLTGHASIDSAVSLIKQGAFDYLSKPIDLQDFLKAIDKAIERIQSIRKRESTGDISKIWHVSQMVDKNLTSNRLLQGILENAIKATQATGGVFFLFFQQRWKDRIRVDVSLETSTRILEQIHDHQDFWKNNSQEKITKNSLKSLKLDNHSYTIACPFIDQEKIIGILALFFENKTIDIQLPGLLAVFSSQVYNIVTMAIRINNLLQIHEESIKNQAEVERLHEELKQSTKLACIGELSASIAHDINTPLTCINGFIQLALRSLYSFSSPQVEQPKLYLEKSLEEIKRCQSILKDLLMFARKENRVYEPFSWKHLLEKVSQLLAPSFEENKIFLEIKIPENLPSILGNANQIQQVLMNLLVNAQKAMPEGGTIQVITQIKDSKIQIEITDSGVGISPENLYKIFEPFFTTRTSGKGTGLGLSISQKIIQEHGGKISVKSEIDKGTTFTIVFPIT